MNVPRFDGQISLGQILVAAPLVGLIWTVAAGWQSIQDSVTHETTLRVAAVEALDLKVANEHTLMAVRHVADQAAIMARIDAMAEQRAEDSRATATALARIELRIRGLADGTSPVPPVPDRRGRAPGQGTGTPGPGTWDGPR